MNGLRWPIGRETSSSLFIWLFLIMIGFAVSNRAIVGAVDLTALPEGIADALVRFDEQVAWRLTLRIALHLLLAVVLVARLHDADYSAGWVAGWFALDAAALVSSIGLWVIVDVVALALVLMLPPTIGPNRFGRDPRGWASREHFDDQLQELITSAGGPIRSGTARQ